MKNLTIQQLSQLTHKLALESEKQLDTLDVVSPAKRRSAVLVGLQEKETEPHLVLTRRTDHLKHHPGQICFPGGRYEPHQDSDLAQTVRREVEEELGIAARHVDLWLPLPAIDTITGFTITPIFGQLQSDDYFPCSHEVAEILEVPLSFFFEPNRAQLKTVTYEGKSHSYWVYQYENHTIWGATAKIIHHLVQRLDQAFGE